MKYLILLLPLVYARYQHDGITVSIEPGPSEDNTTIQYKGEDIKIITESDKAAFNITKENIARAVEILSGEKATDIFTNSPTPWDDLYKSYNWREIKREFRIKDAKLINITKEEMNLSARNYTNDGNESKNIEAVVLDGYETFTSRHYWSGNEKISAVVRYNLTRPYDPPLHYGYNSKVGQYYFGSGVTILTYGESAAYFSLEPGQKAKFYVKSNQVQVGIQIEYETSLNGDLAVNYANKHEGHHFWAYDINEVLSAANMTNTATSIEYIEIKYLTDYETKVIDVTTQKDIQFKGSKSL